ncbi:pilus assembly protein N-terminal domain-containing protein [Cobetia sp. 10Alg 146]|uniref:pilus assembly protein N-terminal domain-containing protein n=1 Tax=Cobetia sp. 10Alg 146 TaxID=3040019 RepID=UPI00244B8991|nr:pilus assembly protein N-terminal domain-containing protein [Cobetia sp. 10Alg 146]MDH2290046.1 pilus assembly protein N-terminal domain-containing protein [Cobetia sp. 10Alg 146]
MNKLSTLLPETPRLLLCLALFSAGTSHLVIAAEVDSAPLAVGKPALVGSDLPAAGLINVDTAYSSGSSRSRTLVQWTHARLAFGKDIERIAVGKQSIIEVEVIGGREVLMLGKEVGRTTVMVWYADGSNESFLFSVSPDLSVLGSALREIHPSISIHSAPDRPVLVMRGKVPTADYRQAAQQAAMDYLLSGQRGAAQPAAAMGLQAGAPTMGMSTSMASPVINLIKVTQKPKPVADKLKEAIASLGGEEVTVRRLQFGEMPNDLFDTFLLEGEVRDQVALTRILNVAARVVGGSPLAGGDAGIDVLADESGALMGDNARAGGYGGSITSSSGVGGGGSLSNNIRNNIARSKVLSIAGGRLISMIEVRDVPQVRVAIQMHEVNRSRMKAWRPDLSIMTNGYNASGPLALGETGAAGASGLENALQILDGTLINNLQIGGSDIAFDLLFSLMENEGISRTLSRPTLTVLAGESSVFQVGGEIPVPSAFAPSGVGQDDTLGANTNGVFSGTDFKSFGVQLSVRALVDENDRITLDVLPTISTPDTLLTQQIADSTGSELNSTAFNVRSLRTTTRLRDGQPLILGGLVSRDMSGQEDRVPGASDVPLLGWMTRSFNRSDVDKELVIIVTPTLIREPINEVAQWSFPDGASRLADMPLSRLPSSR